MQYKNQLVLTGALNAVGSPIRTNVGESYRVGLEIDANIKIANKWAVRPNITISENKNKDFVNDNGTSLDKLGNTNLAYSPKIVAGNILSFVPIKNWEISLLSKFVGEQFLSNLEDKNSKLKDYYIQNFHLSYVIEPKKIVKAIEISFLANNIFDTQYISNGADYGGGYVVYFPQAGANILAGLTLKF